MDEARKFSIFARSVVAGTVTYAVGLTAAAIYYAPLAYEKAKAGTLSNASSTTQLTMFGIVLALAALSLSKRQK